MKQTPQEKKIRNYTHQRKNSYGENDKSSRRALRKRKRWVNRSYRRSVRHITSNSSLDIESLNESVNNVKRKQWRKWPDMLIVESLTSRWSGSSQHARKPFRSSLRNEALKRLRRSKTRYGL